MTLAFYLWACAFDKPFRDNLFLGSVVGVVCVI